MIARNDSTPIKIPNPCVNPAGLGPFSRDVIAAIKSLRDRKVLYDIPFRPGSVKNTNHEWKVTYSGETGSPAEDTWNVVGGDVVTQGGTFTVADTDVTGESGYVVLKITRDEASREATAVIIQTTVAALSVPVSDYVEQYITLAKVDATLEPGERVIQLQFERLNIHEMLVVTNGTFDLAQFRMASSNIYDPPS